MKKTTLLLLFILLTQNLYSNFRGIKWSTPRSEVLRLMKTKPSGSLGNNDFWKVKFSNYKFLISLRYKKNKLFVAACSYLEKKEHILIYKMLRRDLFKKYGEPFHYYTEIKGKKVEKILPIDEKLFYKGQFERDPINWTV